MSLLNKEDDIIEDVIGDVVLAEIKKFLYNHLFVAFLFLSFNYS